VRCPTRSCGLHAFASLPAPRPSAGNGTRYSSSCGPFKVQVGEYGVYQPLDVQLGTRLAAAASMNVRSLLWKM
jgi:hypothetical protein